MYEQLPSGNLLVQSYQGVDWDNTYLLNTKSYGSSYLTSDEANALSWQEFGKEPHIIARVPVAGTVDLEAIIMPKTVTWSDRDVNIFVGSRSKNIRSYQDLSADEFARVFEMQLSLAYELSSETEEDVYCTHGFNVIDTSPDAHSIREKFHTHMHIPNKSERVQLDANQLTTFEKLMLIEPFAGLFWDYLYSQENFQFLDEWQAHKATGFLSFRTELDEFKIEKLYQVHELLRSFEAKYDQAVNVYTAKITELQTGYNRYIPRSREHISELLGEFFINNQDWLSPGSMQLLAYLADNIKTALPRKKLNTTDIENSFQLWIAKGFSGAINFVVSAKSNSMQFDFAPRIISTSGATKILSDSPTIIRKNNGEATLEELVRLKRFEFQIAQLALGSNAITLDQVQTTAQQPAFPG